MNPQPTTHNLFIYDFSIYIAKINAKFNFFLSIMEHLKDYIHSKRPNLSNSSLITYTSILKNLYHKVFGNDVDFHKFDDAKFILHYLKDIPGNKRKTILSALVIITDNKQYRDLMMKDVQQYNKEILRQEKTPEQVASWVDGQEIKEI